MELMIGRSRKTLIDAEDMALLEGHPPQFDGRYAHIDIRVNGKKKKIYLHRLIAGATISSKQIVVDHINGDRLDNRRCNLRIVSQSINVRNREPGYNRTGFPGVHFSPWCSSKTDPKKRYLRKNPYKAEIKKDGRRINIGRFGTAEQAFEAYKAKALELFGTIHPIFRTK